MNHPTPVSPEISPEVSARLTAEPQGVAFRPVFTVLYPPAAIGLVKKVVLAPIVKLLQWITKTSDRASVATRLAFLHGITIDDITHSIQKWIQAGLPEAHPEIDRLKNLKDELRDFKKNHPVLTRLAKEYHQYSAVTGQTAETNYPLLERQRSFWEAKKGYAWQLKEQLNGVGLRLQTHQWSLSDTGRLMIRFIPQEKLAKLFSKISQPVLAWLGKTGLGTASKIGAKKIAGWLATRLGIEAGIVAAGTAAAPGVGTAIAIVISAVIEVAKKAWGKLKLFIHDLVNRPEKALGLLGFGVVTLVVALTVLPIPIAVAVATVPIALGSLGLLAWGTTGAGGFFSGLANGIAGFFTSLTLIPASGAPVALLVVGTLGSLSLLTFFIVMTTAGAFILPVNPAEIAAKKPTGLPGIPPGLPPPGPKITIGTPVEPREMAETEHLAEKIIKILNECGINEVNVETWDEVVFCLKAAGPEGAGFLTLGELYAVLKEWQYSVHVVKGGVLQCVGFVRGIMGALGKPLEGDRDASDYLEDPPAGYFIVSVEGIAVGDLAVWKGSEFGHIGIIVHVDQENNLIWVAQAWGTANGSLQITELNPAYVAAEGGFLRPK